VATQPSEAMVGAAGASASTSRSFQADLAAEFERLLRPPRDELTSIAIDAVLVSVAWALLPASVHEWLFSLSGPMAFAVVLQAWMLGDSATTNVLGNDVAAALETMPDPARFRRLLRIKTVAVASIVAATCVLVCAVVAAAQHAFLSGLMLCAVLLVAPFGAVALAEWVGIRWPYHRRPLQWRWEQRRMYRRTVRWLLLVMSPLLLVPTILAAFLASGIAAGSALGGRNAHGHLDATGLTIAAGVAALCAAGAFVAAPHGSITLARRRQAALRDFLRDPGRG